MSYRLSHQYYSKPLHVFPVRERRKGNLWCVLKIHQYSSSMLIKLRKTGQRQPLPQHLKEHTGGWAGPLAFAALKRLRKRPSNACSKETLLCQRHSLHFLILLLFPVTTVSNFYNQQPFLASLKSTHFKVVHHPKWIHIVTKTSKQTNKRNARRKPAKSLEVETSLETSERKVCFPLCQEVWQRGAKHHQTPFWQGSQTADKRKKDQGYDITVTHSAAQNIWLEMPVAWIILPALEGVHFS